MVAFLNLASEKHMQWEMENAKFSEISAKSLLTIINYSSRKPLIGTLSANACPESKEVTIEYVTSLLNQPA